MIMDDKDIMTTHVEDTTPASKTHHAAGLQPEEEPVTGYSVGAATYLAIFALALANACATLSNTTNTVIKFQIQDVGGASVASWIANGNFLLTLAFGPIFGSLADRLGKKWFIVGGCAIGLVGSFVSSSAKDVYTIIGGNILTGIAVRRHLMLSARLMLMSFKNAGCIVSIAANQEISPNAFRPYAFGFAVGLYVLPCQRPC